VVLGTVFSYGGVGEGAKEATKEGPPGLLQLSLSAGDVLCATC